MRNSNSIPSDETMFAEYIRERLDYDPENGVFVWKPKTLNGLHGRAISGTMSFNANIAGTIAGSANGGGYLSIGLFGRNYKSHRLAWLYVYGKWPAGQIDHINGIGHDNRMKNLRDVPRAENTKNIRSRVNSTGVPGVSAHYGKFRARISINGKRKHLGSFDTSDEALAAYRAAVLANGFDPLHGVHADARAVRVL